MQIRTRGSKTSLWRATYDPKTKRTRQVSLGTYSFYGVKTLDQLGPDIREKLTSAEAEELAEYFEVKTAAEQKQTVQREILRIGRTLGRVAELLQSEEEVAGETLLDALQKIDIITKAIKKRGIKKKDIRPAKIHKVPEGQTSIFSDEELAAMSGHVRPDESGRNPDNGGVQ